MRLVKKGMIIGAKPEVKRRAEATRMDEFRQKKIDFQYFSIIEQLTLKQIQVDHFVVRA